MLKDVTNALLVGSLVGAHSQDCGLDLRPLGEVTGWEDDEKRGVVDGNEAIEVMPRVAEEILEMRNAVDVVEDMVVAEAYCPRHPSELVPISRD